MTIFKRIDIDMAVIRACVDSRYNKRQKAALNKLYDLFEAGEWKQCLAHVADKKAFPRNYREEYPEAEHIAVAVSDVLHGLVYHNFYTSEQLLKDAVEKLAERK